MAERRMFTKKVTDDDNFLSLSSSAQALYLHLSMSADDDGFCNQVSVAMFKAHASVQDLQSLLENRYIYQFDNGVIVIKHWRMANALRKDRYTPTAFKEELSRLQLKDNGSYTWLPNGCQLSANCLPQDSIGKNSIDKDSINTLRNEVAQSDKQNTQKPASKYAKHFEDLWKIYPRKKEKSNAYRAYNARLKDGYSEDELMTAVQKYAKECEDTHREERYIKLCATFLGPNTPFTDYLKGGTDEQPGGEHTESKYSDYQKEYFSHYGITDL